MSRRVLQEKLCLLELFVQAVGSNNQPVGPLLLLLAGVVPCVPCIDLPLPSVKHAMGRLDILIIGPFHCLASVSKVLDNMLYRRKIKDHAEKREWKIVQ